MAGVGRSSRVPPSPHLFSQAVSTVMKDWQALRIAVDNMFGGPSSKEKASWLERVTVEFMCNNADVQSWELEDYLSVLMDQEFKTSVEDASIPMISKKICDLYDQYQRGNVQLIQEFIAKSQQSPSVPSPPVQCKEEEEEVDGLEIVEEEEEEKEEESTSIDLVQENIDQLQLTEQSKDDQEVNEEGWEVVRKNRRKSKH